MPCVHSSLRGGDRRTATRAGIGSACWCPLLGVVVRRTRAGDTVGTSFRWGRRAVSEWWLNVKRSVPLRTDLRFWVVSSRTLFCSEMRKIFCSGRIEGVDRARERSLCGTRSSLSPHRLPLRTPLSAAAKCAQDDPPAADYRAP